MNRTLLLLCALCLLSLLSTPNNTLAQKTTILPTTKQKGRPRIGLVLSGGGARGFAHVGLLRLMEETGLRPDYIVGTSMGAILGALYAMGYTADDINDLNRTTNWNTLLSNQWDLRTISYEQKHAVNRDILTISWNNGRFYLPQGLIKSQSLLNLLHRLNWPYANKTDFNALPIPYGCISVDLASGQTRIARYGHLPTEIRASMAIPGIFTPVILGDSLLVDGGVADNFPYDLVRSMGADIVIGSYTGPPLSQSDRSIYNTKSILIQASLFAGIQKARTDIAKCNYLTIPDLTGYSTMNFAAGERITQIGYQAALPLRNKLKHLADSIYAIEAPPRIPHVDTAATHYVKKVEIVQSHSRQNIPFLTNQWIPTPAHITARQIENAINQLYGTRFFEQVSYRLGRDSILRILPQARDKFSLQLGAHGNDEWGLGFVARMELLNPIFASSRLELATLIATQPSVLARHTLYLGKKRRLLFATNAGFTTSRTAIYLAGSRIASLMRYEAQIELTLGELFANYALLDGGFRYHATLRVPSRAYRTLTSTTNNNSQQLQGFARFRANTTERHDYPKIGYLLNAELNTSYLLAATPQFNARFTGSYIHNLTLTNLFTLRPRFAIGLNTTHTSEHYKFAIGGLPEYVRNEIYDIPLLGLGYRQKHFHNFALTTLDLQINLPYSLHLIPSIGLALGANNITDWLSPTTDTSGIGTCGLTLGWLQQFGKLETSLGYTLGTHDLWWHFFIGVPL